MTSFRAALDRALRFAEGGSDDRVCARVSEAFSNWTQRAELTVTRPWRSEPPEAIAEAAVRSEPARPPAILPMEERPRVFQPEEDRSNPSWSGERGQSEIPSLHVDYYETLQISRTAEIETIHRVYRIMAARFHPDNALTGSLDNFLALREAYQVLSKPNLRAEYDRSLDSQAASPLAVFGQKGFVGGHQTETNRRLGVLSLLYNRRRLNGDRPGISMLDLERLMSLPREYLQFTLWYLKSKGYIAVEEHSDYCVTPSGVDYLEEQSGKNKLTQELLTGESEAGARDRGPAELIECTKLVLPARKVRKGRVARRSRRAVVRRAEPAA